MAPKLRFGFSWLLILGGLFLAAFGAGEWLGSILNQRRIARTWKPVPRSAGSRPPAQAGVRPGETIGELVIPRLGAHLFVVEGDDERDLRAGPGHLEGSAMPGGNDNCIIAGHRDTHFRVLKDVRKGDEIVLQTAAGEFRYVIRNTRVVYPSNTKSLQPTPGRPVLHLITCFPFYYVGPAPKRFIVEAELDTARAAAPHGTSEPSS
jgi:sortase A